MMFVFDLADSSQPPLICEPLFLEPNAKVDIVPAMNLDELQAGLQKLGQRA